jgi:DNA polymerase III subunit epsilon
LILIFDTETTGLPECKLPSDDPRQPHLVELSTGLFAEDGTEIDVSSVIVRPDGWSVPPDMTAIHRITNEHAMEVGLAEAVVARGFYDTAMQCTTWVAHNLHFDKRIMRIAMRRAGLSRDQIAELDGLRRFDTCNGSKHVTNLPPTAKMLNAGFTWPKNPKLSECMSIIFGEDHADAHDALRDVRACARLYFHLRSIGEAA